MADQFSRMYDVERIGGDQRTRLAEMLRAAGQNMPQGQMVSGWYVAPSWTQNLAQLANTALGTYLGNQVDEERNKTIADLMRKRKEGVEVEPIPAVQNFNGMQSMAEGQTSMAQQAPQNELERITQRRTSTEQSMPSPAMMQQQPQRYRPMTQDELDENMMQMYRADPSMASLLSNMETSRASRAEAKALKEEQRAWQSEENRLNREARRDDKLFAASLAASNRPERMLTVLDTNTGMPLTIPQSQMQPGMTIYNPTTAKAFAEQKEKGLGKKGVSDTLDVLETQYKALNAGMGMPSTENRWGSNLGAKVAGTGVGQWAGQVLGTENQKARDIIAQTRPLMLADIKKATGMTASEMNSDRELQMWLAAATDPTKGYEANMEAIKNLRNKYGLGTNQSSSSW